MAKSNTQKVVPIKHRAKKGSIDEAVDTSLLSSRAMLVSLNISHFNPAITDRKVTREVHATHNVTDKAGKYRKNRIDVDSPVWKAVIETKSALRSAYYEMTLPWGRTGARIMTTLVFEEFTARMRRLEAAFTAASAQFIDAFPSMRDQAKKDLNDLYNPDDYPDNIAAKFGCSFKFEGINNPEDFRVNLAKEHVIEIRKEIAADIQKTVEESMKEPYRRLYDRITKLAAGLMEVVSVDKKGRQSKKGLNESFITKLNDLVEVMPALNLTHDPVLTDLTERSHKLVKNMDVEELKQKPELKKAAAKEAQAIQSLMATMMGPMLETQDEESL